MLILKSPEEKLIDDLRAKIKDLRSCLKDALIFVDNLPSEDELEPYVEYCKQLIKDTKPSALLFPKTDTKVG